MESSSSDRKLKPLPPDPARHQDSAIAREAIRLDPVQRAFRFNDRGNALRDAGQYDRALADYEKALNIEPKNGWIFLERGRTYAKMHQVPAAKRDFETAIAVDSSNLELRASVKQELATLSSVPSMAAPVRPELARPQPSSPAAPPARARARISSGSAFAVSRYGHLMTNNHVVADCASIEAAGLGSAMVVSRDSANDLALLRLTGQSHLEPLKVRSKATRLGEEVIALGYPLRGVLGDGLNVTTGIVSALSGIGNDSTQLQFTAPIQPGNSGGALVDRMGGLVGVVRSKLSDTTALKLAGFVPQGTPVERG